MWVPTAAIVVEVVSPDDETWEKFDFYARHRVEEICIADPMARQIRWFVLAGDAYEETDASPLLGVTHRRACRRHRLAPLTGVWSIRGAMTPLIDQTYGEYHLPGAEAVGHGRAERHA